MNIRYQDSADGVEAHQLQGFFVGWSIRPSCDNHLRLLRSSTKIALAIADDDAVVGFGTALSDGVAAAYIPFLEVLPSHQRQGIGSELLRRLLDSLVDLYMVDLSCDPDVGAFYESLGMTPGSAMMIRRRDALESLS